VLNDELASAAHARARASIDKRLTTAPSGRWWLALDCPRGRQLRTNWRARAGHTRRGVLAHTEIGARRSIPRGGTHALAGGGNALEQPPRCTTTQGAVWDYWEAREDQGPAWTPVATLKELSRGKHVMITGASGIGRSTA